MYLEKKMKNVEVKQKRKGKKKSHRKILKSNHVLSFFSSATVLCILTVDSGGVIRRENTKEFKQIPLRIMRAPRQPKYSMSSVMMSGKIIIPNGEPIVEITKTVLLLLGKYLPRATKAETYTKEYPSPKHETKSNC